MAVRRRRPETEEGDDEEWLVTYADAITLLMAFFIMLVSFSKIELPIFEQVQAGIKEHIGGQVDSERPIFQLQSKVNNIIQDANAIPQDQVDVGFDDQGIVIDFAEGSFFAAGTADLDPGTAPILKGIVRLLQDQPYDLFFVDVEGHTDDVPISTPKFPSNWELSAARAARVVREFIADGMAPDRLKAAGYADTKPKVPNKDITGEPIPENRAKNRRITIRLHP